MKLNKRGKIFISLEKILISISTFFLFAAFLHVASCKMPSEQKKVTPPTREHAINKAQEFCVQFNLGCKAEKLGDGKTIGYLSWMFNQYHRLHLIDEEYLRGQHLSFEDENASKKNIKDYYIVFIIGDKSKEVDLYQNHAILERYIKLYGFSHKTGQIMWPEFLPERKAKEIIDSIATKLEMPSDMVFDKIEKHEEYGLWNAVWLRKRNGYRYEGDAISMSIMGSTGEFVAYAKTYRGVPCSTDMKISREQAIEIGWKKLQKYFTWKLKKIGNEARDLYDLTTETLIIQTSVFWPRSEPVEIEGSKLAWIIRYTFTGGLENPRKNMSEAKRSKEEIKELVNFEEGKLKKWREFGAPDQNYEIRIDAATGRILYSSPMRLWFMRWFGELTVKRY